MNLVAAYRKARNLDKDSKPDFGSLRKFFLEVLEEAGLTPTSSHSQSKGRPYFMIRFRDTLVHYEGGIFRITIDGDSESGVTWDEEVVVTGDVNEAIQTIRGALQAHIERFTEQAAEYARMMNTPDQEPDQTEATEALEATEAEAHPTADPSTDVGMNFYAISYKHQHSDTPRKLRVEAKSAHEALAKFLKIQPKLEGVGVLVTSLEIQEQKFRSVNERRRAFLDALDDEGMGFETKREDVVVFDKDLYVYFPVEQDLYILGYKGGEGTYTSEQLLIRKVKHILEDLKNYHEERARSCFSG